MVMQLQTFASEVNRVTLEVGSEGILGGQAKVEGVQGTWADLTTNVNVRMFSYSTRCPLTLVSQKMAANLTDQVRSIADVSMAVADGDLSKIITLDVRGEMLDMKNTVNSMVSRLLVLATEVTRVSLEVGTEGVLGGQAVVPNFKGIWEVLANNVNLMVRRHECSFAGQIDDFVPGMEHDHPSAVDCRSRDRGHSRRLDKED